jgi:outer membrane biosynthesis protein TonB
VIRAALPAAVLAAALVLTGCSTTDSGIGAGTATALQQEVRHIASLAAAHRYPAALTAATVLRSDLGTAVDTGRVSGDRAGRIRAALGLVENDLRAAQPALSPTTSPSPSPSPAVTPARTPTAAPTPTATPAKKKKAEPKPAPAPLKPWKQHGKKGKGGKGRGG